jgi:beta-alanine degradation protein BauB
MHEAPTDEFRRSLLRLLPMLALAECAEAQDAAKTQPQAYRVALENDKLRVLDYNSRPGMGVCGSGMHSHPAHLTVVVSGGGSVRIKTPDGKTVEQHDIPAGVVFWSEAETHIVENISGNNMRSLIIELKTGKG